MSTPPADWYPDPTGRFDYRYWDGQRWTDHVSADGTTGTDPLEAAPPADDGASSSQGATAAGPATAAEPGTATAEEPGTATGDEPEGPGPLPASGQTPATVGGPADGEAGAAAAADGGGVHTDLLGAGYREHSGDEPVGLQNDKMLRIVLGEDVLARRGTVVAFQGDLGFDRQGTGEGGATPEEAPTGGEAALVRCSGTGELFLARDADDVHIVELRDAGLTVNGDNLLAFEPALEWDIERVEAAGTPAGGRFHATLRGTGWAAITTHGTPVTLTVEKPTFADADAAVAWSPQLSTSLTGTFEDEAPEGRGAAAMAQLAFSGDGFVIVQASEGSAVAPHDHGG